MEQYLLILIVFFIFVAFFIVKTSQYEGYRTQNTKSDDERYLNQQIDQINRIITRAPSSSPFTSRLLKI